MLESGAPRGSEGKGGAGLGWAGLQEDLQAPGLISQESTEPFSISLDSGDKYPLPMQTEGDGHAGLPNCVSPGSSCHHRRGQR